MSGRKLTTPPRVFLGAAENPFAPPHDFAPHRLAKKIAAGAQFVQTQYCFDLPMLQRVHGARRATWVSTSSCFILVGVGPLASAKAARWMRASMSPASISPTRVDRAPRSAQDQRAEGKRICIEMIQQLREEARASPACT